MPAKRTLERLKYKLLPPVGPGSFSAEGSVADLLFDIPYFFLAKVIPPIDVVNEVLQKGVVDAGMSGGLKWKPFELDAASYAKLTADLRQMDFVTIQPPDWVQNHSDWHRWCAELVWGIPARESRRPDNFPLLLERVVYSGSHSGDSVAASEAVQLLTETRKLRDLTSDPTIVTFANELTELAEASIATGNPIAF